MYSVCFCHPWKDLADSFLAQPKQSWATGLLPPVGETMYWGEAATRFWSYIIQMGAPLLFAATLCLWNNSPKLPFEDGLRLDILLESKPSGQHTVILGSFIIFRWCCQQLRSLEQQCRTSPPGGCPGLLGDFQWSALSRYIGIGSPYKLYLSLILFSIFYYGKNKIQQQKRPVIISSLFLSVSTFWRCLESWG